MGLNFLMPRSPGPIFGKIGKAFEFPKAGETYRSGVDTMASGTEISDTAISGLTSDIGGYQALIKSGGLTPALMNQFNVARARVLDQGSQQRGALRAGLAQRSLQTPGGISAAAEAELTAGGNENIGASEFGATQDVNAQEAQVGFESTNRLLDRINQARTAILGAGDYRLGIGAGLRENALDVMLRRRQAIASSIVGGVSGGMGGGGFH